MKMYRERWGDTIEPIEVAKATKNFVEIRYGDYRGKELTRKEAKNSDCHSYHDTMQGAVEACYTRNNWEIDKLKMRIKEYEGKNAKVKAMHENVGK